MSASASFRYRAVKTDGSVVRGVASSDSPEALAVRLSSQGLYLLDSRAVRGTFRRRRRVSRQDLAVVFRNVAALARAGMPVERAMRASETLVGGPLRDALDEVRRSIREGRGVADAMSAQGEVFPAAIVGMIRAGERGSQLADALDRVASQLESEAALRSQVQSALAYPAMIVVVGLVSVVVMGGVVVPRFADVLAELGAELPRSTRVLLAASTLLRRYGVPGVIGFALGSVALSSLLRREDARCRFHAVLLRVPVLGGIRLGFASARTCRALGAMLATGMPLLSALDAVGDAAGDAEVARRLRQVREAVARGERLTPSLERAHALVPLALQLVGVGESSGDLGRMVGRAGDLAGERTERSLRALVSLLEPIMVIGLGFIVALTAGALLQAVYSVRPGV
jgi:general secretion pathway protein F